MSNYKKTLIKYSFINFILLLIISIILSLSIIYSKDSYYRLYICFSDFINVFTFFGGNKNLKVLTLRKYIVNKSVPEVINNSSSEVIETVNKLELFKTNFIDTNNLFDFFKYYLMNLTFIFQIILALVAIYFMLKLFKSIHQPKQTIIEKESLALKCYINFKNNILDKFFNFIKDIFNYLSTNRFYKITFIVLLLIVFRVPIILIEFISYYLYLIFSLNFNSISFQFYKLWYDLLPYLKSTNFLNLILIYYLFCKWRNQKGLNKLQYLESRNKKFIEKTSVGIMLTGTMGSKKTTTITDMSLSTAEIFRNKANELMYDIQMKFPDFNYLRYEKEISKKIVDNTITSLQSTEEYFSNMINDLKKSKEKLNNYEYLDSLEEDNKKLFFYDNLTNNEFIQKLEEYTKLYFIYTLQSSLIISNYAIKENYEIVSIGNYPIIIHDYFDHNYKNKKLSHILDFDYLRMGKTFNDDPESFEFGVLTITEIAKERGNQFDVQGVKKDSEEVNRKNDLFNSKLKLLRHSSTVAFYPFVKLFVDDQRSDSLNADNKQLLDIVSIQEVSEDKLAIPFYTLRNELTNIVLSNHKNYMYNWKFNRADNTLLNYFITSICSKIYKNHIKIINQYSYNKSSLQVVNELSGMSDVFNYYLLKKKIHSERFATDCYNEFLKTKKSISYNKISVYSNVKASVEDLKKQKSFFIDELTNLTKNK